MAAGLVASYGTFAAIAARYLYPPRPTRTGWIFVTDVAKARALTKHAAETGKVEQARAVDAMIDAILARPEHAWKAASAP